MLRAIRSKERRHEPVNEATWRVPIDGLLMHLFIHSTQEFLVKLTGYVSGQAEGNEQ
ncbi:uncharacterized protein PHACADRAFT_249111 [Phanerochaete carnosa HHB-10118-sp]|uniref:Uncharacterized protein n=1 Tax=Phanerochaete carnosa (strain HHB-10118-sp) TaxID=650164 RepID=K5WIN9_PHACS|nr:uncharacterized protein PHACADRAFT_249111 [Phanerochaete carnosa HHB-10118-sp]EKM58974.1 hypothetical protein PHACADRAFT_249111 [Phanerochaete carnosa HHB-10118-sp]